MADTSSGELLAHAVRLWQAEEENARRLSRRVNLNLTIVSAIIGLGLLNLVDPSAAPEWLSWLIRGSLVVGLLFLATGGLHLLKFFDPPKERDRESDDPAIASAQLLLRGDEPERVATSGLIGAQVTLALKTLRAADYLGDQNARERVRIDTGQQYMLLGFFCILEGLIGLVLTPTEKPFLIVALMILIAGIAFSKYRTASGRPLE